MAHGFKTRGRQKGSLNKVTSEMKATIAVTPLLRTATNHEILGNRAMGGDRK